MRALLDVNVLIALLDADHIDHWRARDWLGAEIGHGWASCAITQNGAVRILSQPQYPSPVPVAEAADRLHRATASSHHEFWSSEVSFLDRGLVDRSRVHGPRQVTDVYLLALAVHQGGRFVTFDGRISLEAVPGAEPRHLLVL